MPKEDEIGAIVDFAKLVGGELNKIDKMSSSEDKIQQACRLDIHKIIPKNVEPLKHVEHSKPMIVGSVIPSNNNQQKNIGSNLILEELIKMNQKFDLLLSSFQKKKRKKRSKKSWTATAGGPLNGQSNTNTNNNP